MLIGFALSLLLVPMFSQNGTAVFAESSTEVVEINIQDLNVSKQDLKAAEKEENELVTELKDASSEDYDTIVDDFMEESDTALPSIAENYLNENDIEDDFTYDETLINEYKIDENNLVTITPTEIYLETIEASEEEVVTDQKEIEKFEEESAKQAEEEKSYISQILDKIFSGDVVQAAAKTNRRTATHTATYYARLLGQKVVTVGIGAEFTYNGSTVTARTTEHYTKTHWGSLGVWQLKSSKNGVQTPSKSRRIAYQEANFVEGITYKGNGLSFQSRYLRASLDCNQNGVYSRVTVSR